MSDMLSTIAPKSDQQNYDDFIGGRTRTIKITGVKIVSGDQPASLNFEGDEGKPYKPCKSMRRVIVHCWGSDTKAYVGRSMTLYGDPKVRFGGADVGGIRISHMSDIDGPITIALTATRAQRKPYTVQPLTATPPKHTTTVPPNAAIDEKIALARLATTLEELEQTAAAARLLKGWTKAKTDEMKSVLEAKRAEFKTDRQPGEDG